MSPYPTVSTGPQPPSGKLDEIQWESGWFNLPRLPRLLEYLLGYRNNPIVTNLCTYYRSLQEQPRPVLDAQVLRKLTTQLFVTADRMSISIKRGQQYLLIVTHLVQRPNSE